MVGRSDTKVWYSLSSLTARLAKASEANAQGPVRSATVAKIRKGCEGCMKFPDAEARRGR